MSHGFGFRFRLECLDEDWIKGVEMRSRGCRVIEMLTGHDKKEMDCSDGTDKGDIIAQLTVYTCESKDEEEGSMLKESTCSAPQP